MQTTKISIHRAGPSRAVDISSVALTAGDQVTFSAAHDAPSLLCFTGEAAGLLAAPSASVEIPASGSVTYTVGAAAAQEYVIAVQTHHFPVPHNIPAGAVGGAATLKLVIPGGDDYPFPDPPPGGGDGL